MAGQCFDLLVPRDLLNDRRADQHFAPEADTPGVLPDDLDIGALRPSITSLGLPFLSVDLAISSSTGGLRIVEIGDGQVSDRPSTHDPVRFVEAITRS